MLDRVKRFIRARFNNERYPAIHAFYKARDERRTQEVYERHQHMTYAEIEEEISRQYREMFGRAMDWDKPKTYNEKIHVSKVYMPTPEKTRLADKVAVREWITEKIGGQYLIPMLGVYDSFDDIDFDVLPDKFVIKCNHDSGSYTLCHDKRQLDMRDLKRKYDNALAYNFAYMGFEMHYRDIRPKIVIENYIDNAALNDYRFYCFDGKPYYCAIDYYDDTHKRNARNIYGMDWDLQPFLLSYPNYYGEVLRPDNFDAMKGIAAELCKGFGHVRVDLYSAGKNIYFGEMTFTHANGFQKFIPDEWDYRLGELWPFDNTVRRKVLASSTRP